MHARHLISADDHLDLLYLPPDLWTARLPQSLGSRGPRVIQLQNSDIWVCDGLAWGRYTGRPPGARGDPSPCRPIIPQLRLEDMDRDGIAAQVLFGPVAPLRFVDPSLQLLCIRAYNDWLREFSAFAPGRMIGVGLLPADNPHAAFLEAERVAHLHLFRQVSLLVPSLQPPLYDLAWQPLLSLLEESGILLALHVGVPSAETSSPAGAALIAPNALAHSKILLRQYLDPFVDLFAWGVLERHPRLRVVFAEAGLGWIPWVVQDLDKRFAEDSTHRGVILRGPPELRRRPSAIFREQVWVTFGDDTVGMSSLEHYGEGHAMWASDYPHPDGTWPNSRATVERQMAHLSPEICRALTWENAQRLYGIEEPRLERTDRAAESI